MPTPAQHTIDPLRAVRELRLALVELSDGLSSGRLDTLLAVEPRLATAVGGITAAAAAFATGALTTSSPRELGPELEAARAVMTRCALLGRNLDDVVRARCGSGYISSGSSAALRLQPSIQEQA